MSEVFESDDENDFGSDDVNSKKIDRRKRVPSDLSSSDEESEGSAAPKKKSKLNQSSMFDNEAEESGEEDGEDEDDDGGEAERGDDYEYDDFVVKDVEDDYNMKKRKEFQKKYQRLRRTATVADDDDIELIRDNMASASEKKHDDVIVPEQVHDDDSDINDGANALDDEDDKKGRHQRAARDEYDSDSLSDFVVDDMDDDMGNAEAEDPEVRRQRRKERAERMKTGMIGGELREQLAEAAALFGEGYEEYMDEDYSDEDEDVFGDIAAANEAKKLQQLRSRFDRSTLVEIYATEKDDILRETDRPERMIDIMVGRQPPDADERADEGQWIAQKLSQKIIEEDRLRGVEGMLEEHQLAEEIQESVVVVLELLQEENREVPFIWSYRRDYLHERLTRQHLWFVQSMDEKWEDLVARRNRLLADLRFIEEVANSDRNAVSEQLSRADREERVHMKRQACDEARQNVVVAQEAFDAVNNIADDFDEDDDFGLGQTESEKIVQAETSLKHAKEDLDTATKDLEEEEQLLHELIKTQQSPRASCSQAVAKRFLELFPPERYHSMIMNIRDDLEMRDMHQYISLLFRGCTEEERGTSQGSVSRGDESGGRKKLRRGGAEKEAYFAACKHGSLREIADKFSVRAKDVGDAIRFGDKLKVNPPTPDFDVQDIPSEYISTDFPTIDRIMDGVRAILATELAAEPSVRRAARERFCTTAFISTRPTELGEERINPFHELFGLHYLVRKPISELMRSAVGSDKYMYARLMRAKTEGLLEVAIGIPTIKTDRGPRPDLHVFLEEIGLMKAFLPEVPEGPGNEWDKQRMIVLADIAEKHILPYMQDETHRELLRLSNEAIVEESATNFRKMLSVGPFRPSNVQPFDVLRACPQRPAYPSVATVFLPTQPREPIFLAFTDRDGVVRANDLLPDAARNQKKTKLKEFFKATRPDVIAVNTGAGHMSKSVKEMIENYIVREVEASLEAELNERRRAREEVMDFTRYDDDDDIDGGIQFRPDVLLVRDDVARIFGSSSRAKKLLPELLPGAASAVCLCRFVQDPLVEYANMWASADAIGLFGHETMYLDIHPYKDLVSRTKAPMLRALENCLVDAVCDVGVDINMAVSHDHMAGPLAFVAGLGLRKADALRQNIKSLLGFVSSRRELLERKLMGKVVYNNAAGFIRVCDTGQDEHVMDPFDDTRIHPECYVQNDFAPKICASAMETPHSGEQYLKTVLMLKKHCRNELEKALSHNTRFINAWMRGELLELPDKMHELQLSDYAAQLERAGKGKRLKQFDAIKQELRFPWLDLRKPLKEPEPAELFALITGESDYTLYVGLRVGCRVVEAKDKSASVVIENGMRGFVRISNVADTKIEKVSTVLKAGDATTGVVIKVMKDEMKVEVSLKPSHVSQGEEHWLAQRNIDDRVREWWQLAGRKEFDRCFKEKEALDLYQQNYKKRFTIASEQVKHTISDVVSNKVGPLGVSSSGRVMRKIFHPLFKNYNAKQAENFLTGRAPGEIVIRPSSKDQDTLVITWAFQENWYKHIEVKEKDKRTEGDSNLGQTLLIKGESDPFSDLSEIHSRYIEPMNDLVSQMTNYRAFRAGTKEQNEAWLQSEISGNPTRIPYCIRFYEKQPGYFVLCWLLKAGHAVKSEIITVKPEGYKMRDKIFHTPSELIQWFKMNATKKAAPPPPPQGSVPPPPKRASRFSDAYPTSQSSSVTAGYKY